MAYMQVLGATAAAPAQQSGMLSVHCSIAGFNDCVLALLDD
jgi:hypothetical protein